MADGIIGHGSQFQRGDSALDETFAIVSGVTAINGISLTVETSDVTDMQSEGGWREYISSLKDAGEVSLDHNFIPGGENTNIWLGDLNAGGSRNYKLVFPDGTIWAFKAIMTSLDVDDPIDDKMTASATYKVTGKPSFVQ